LKRVTQWDVRDEAWLDVAKGIRQAVTKLSQQRPASDALGRERSGSTSRRSTKSQSFRMENLERSQQ
jgi:hypothetical protein